LWLFGDAASCAQWGAWSSPWAPKGHQPEAPTSGTRKAYNAFGLSDDFSGHLFSTAPAGRVNAESSNAVLLDGLAQTPHQVVVRQDAARYPTSTATQVLFAAHAERVTIAPLPAYSPDFTPMEPLCKQVTKEATHLKHVPAFTALGTFENNASP